MLRLSYPLRQKIATVCFLTFILGFSAGLGVLSVIVYQVYWGDDSNLKKSVILAKINEESVIYFSDEQTPIGSFFENTHRRYTPIGEIPQVMIDAIVASEDKNFYNHRGIDPTAIFRAFLEGVKKGGFRQGGSTLTQQTVKNIINRWDPTFQRKFKEMIAALQLERMYTKKEILEFYLNQFHVAQNGNGIAIAVEYYFDKPIGQLTLVEAAFIAGLVKAPSRYNPFIKFTRESREQAIKNANDRKNYVLGRMHDSGYITKDVYEEAKKTDIVFKKGKFGSNEVSLVDLIKRQLNREEIFEAIKVDSIDDLSRAGLKIHTTIDLDLQNAGQLAMRRRLSSLETTLKGYVPEPESNFKTLRRVEPNQFYYGKVSAIKDDGKNSEVTVDFGLPKGVIPYESLVRFAKLIDLASAKSWEVELKALLKKIKVGDIVYVEAMEVNDNGDQAVLEFHHKPQVNGGLIALEHGQVRSIIPGFDSIGFNRAWDAQRQPGSVFKSLVFFGACQLGWSILDNIDNQRQVFPYQRQLYFPRPDHPSPYRKISMLWAGIMSENLASVHLTYRLVDKLNFEQFKQLMGFMELLPMPDESPADFHYRVAKKTGVQLTTDGIAEQQLQNAIKIDLIPDLTFSRNTDLIDLINKMWWGRDYEKELAINSRVGGGDQETSERENVIRIKLIKNNFIRSQQVANDLANDWRQIQQFVNERSASEALQHPVIGNLVRRFRKLGALGSRPELAYYRVFDTETVNASMADSSDSQSFNPFAGVALSSFDIQMIWDQEARTGTYDSSSIALEDVLMEGFLPYNIFLRLKDTQERRFQSVRAQADKYDLFGYYQHHDFRVALGLNYLVDLSKAMGVRSPLEPVLSFPLGSNVVSIGEVAKIYQTFISGKTYRFYDEGAENQVNLIKRIVDREGNELYAPTVIESQLVSNECALQMREILEKIVTHGTGRRARGELHVALEPENEKSPQIRIPAFGKTGTTNDYNTSSFAGFVPYPTVKGEPLNPENSYTISAYVGYDIPQTMRRGRFKVTGSAGALPVWTDYAKATIEVKKYGDYLDKLDLNLLSAKEWPMRRPANLTPLSIDLPRGIALRVAGSDDYEQFASTNLNQSGEEFQSEFAHGVGRSITSVVRIPADTSKGVWQPLKVFSPFKKDAPKSNNEIVAPSKIQTDPASNTPKLPETDQTLDLSRNQAPQTAPNDDKAEDSRDTGDQVENQNSPDEDKEPSKKPTEQTDATDYIEEDLWE